MSKDIFKLDQIDSQDALINLQRTFADIIRKPLEADDNMKQDPRTEEMIQSNDRTPAHGRLQFYARQYWWRIQDSFDEDFRTVKKLVSNEKYLSLRDEYLNTFPSISYTLRHLGSRFPGFLRTKDHLLADAAEYDWAKMQAFEARSLTPIGLSDVEQPEFPEYFLYLQPYVKLLALEYPVNEINKSETVHEDRSASNTLSKRENTINVETVLSITKADTYLAIHRLNSKVYSKVLTKEQYLILAKFKEGISLEQLEEHISEDSIHIVQESFSEWMALNWLSRNNPNEEDK